MCLGKTGNRVWTLGEKRGMMQRRAFREIRRPRISPPFRCGPCSYSTTGTEDARYADVPKPRRRKSERKPYPTPMKVLIRRAKEEKAARKAEPCRILQPPENGLLIPELVHVARRVNQARESLLDGLSKLTGAVVPVKRCRYCSEVHIGHAGHEIRTCAGAKNGLRSSAHVWRTGWLADMVRFPYCYHLHDRVGKPRVGHDERFQVKRLPAVLELCIQAGLDHEDYATRRRTKPVYSIEGRIVDFEPEMEHEDVEGAPQAEDPLLSFQSDGGDQNSWHYEENSNELSVKTLESWLEMRSGAELMMKTYSVKTCGYCPEVQVGPKGHKVRMCKAARHQFRNGLHAWQEATIDDLIWPNYVWHVWDPHGPGLANELKRYYGKAPAVVELCVQAGAPVPDEYRSMMRLDVVSPDRDEVDLVA